MIRWTDELRREMRARLLGEPLREPGNFRPASLEDPVNPHSEANKMKKVKVGLEDDMIREIDGLAEHEGVKRLEMIRRLVSLGLKVLEA